MKDKMDNRGVEYSERKAAKWVWGTLGGELEREREGCGFHPKPSKMNKKRRLLNTSAVASSSQNK